MHLYVYPALLIDQVTSVDKHAFRNEWLACAGGGLERRGRADGGQRGRGVPARARDTRAARYARDPRAPRVTCAARIARAAFVAYVARAAYVAFCCARFHYPHAHLEDQGFQVIMAFCYLNLIKISRRQYDLFFFFSVSSLSKYYFIWNRCSHLMQKMFVWKYVASIPVGPLYSKA